MKKKSIGVSALGYENKVRYPICVSKKCCEDKHVNLLLIDQGEKKHYLLIKDSNTFMHDQALHRGRNYFVVTVYKLYNSRKTEMSY